MAAHQSLASKIFGLCCWDCEEPVVESSKVPSQEIQPPTYNFLKTEKNELCEQNLKQSNAQPLVGQDKNFSPTNSDFEELTAFNIQTGYPKKNLNRYYQEHWAFRPCLIGRP
ncbi:testis-expressed protein 48 [Arvicanthis niloticus]|uniref:testis-expressed protein 48 n=1 Tax=Arvicanthis niloticus TaxID=61156 RepID=UPI0014874F24|nr:testis-expressed protein 48 [Arvicanthis niloticus]XP_034359901.1 testis-expressed protein 48 [Arvicanthis niloticus]